jgi:hypothetical protein
MLEVVERILGSLFIRQHNSAGFSPLMSHKLTLAAVRAWRRCVGARHAGRLLRSAVNWPWETCADAGRQ